MTFVKMCTGKINQIQGWELIPLVECENISVYECNSQKETTKNCSIILFLSVLNPTAISLARKTKLFSTT